ncbi:MULTISPECIES: glutaredoxin family protein [Pseudoalteromonas]|uniref:glutaredoxin family protein n=1 Tax=Pseudoalteromonas TaxID=53246 RepID=UPI0006BAEFF1|nr:MULTISPECIES: glutaredoxin family protein [Pseudoalteromonas]
MKSLAKYTTIFFITLSLGALVGQFVLPTVKRFFEEPAIEVGNYQHVGITDINKVKIYTVDWCEFCAKAKEMLDKHHVEYIEVDIEKNPQGLKEFEQLSGDGFPLIIIENMLFRGFFEGPIKQKLTDSNIIAT